MIKPIKTPQITGAIVRKKHCSVLYGWDDRTRTYDLLCQKQAPYQLGHIPVLIPENYTIFYGHWLVFDLLSLGRASGYHYYL